MDKLSFMLGDWEGDGKRLDQMLDELRRGGVYMKMEHRASRRKD
jgi:hypothetical protein